MKHNSLYQISFKVLHSDFSQTIFFSMKLKNEHVTSIPIIGKPGVIRLIQIIWLSLTNNKSENNYSKKYLYYECNRLKRDLQNNILQVFIFI